MGERTTVDTAAAAVAVGRKPTTIRKWVQWGWVRRAGRDGRRGLVDLEDVLLANRALEAGDTPRRPS
ncbi:hypothetical protein [Georgenia sp. MJ170]|uniref:hypothetical protein n=1 Tax=Georgenia sunbinii TaxID=3117728 RepID=UPI002F267656